MPTRVLLDTNILIHREAATVVKPEIGALFNWFDRLGVVKCIHPASVEEIGKHGDPRVRQTFSAKLASYNQLQTLAPIKPEVSAVGAADVTENDRNDTKILNELFADRVDYLITEDRPLTRKAEALGISVRVFTIDGFLEKATAENPALAEYKVLAVRRTLFGKLDVSAPFFDSFRQDYGGAAFDKWFNKKSDDPVYVCFGEAGEVVAFLYLKTEATSENYSDIEPPFAPKKRLKIGTFKVELNGYKLGERFLKIIFDNAVVQGVDQIYVTIFDRTLDQQRLIRLLEDFGFKRHGAKKNPYGEEHVYVRSMARVFDAANPRETFPYVSRSARAYLIAIYPEYHTSLLPDSILNTEKPEDLADQEPHRNAIRKVYISRSYFRDLQPGDVLVFYRTGGYHKSVVTTFGIVERTHLNIPSEQKFIELCRKRSVFPDAELTKHWRHKSDRPFIVEFLYAYSFPKRPTMKDLIDNGVIKDVNSAPRGFERITRQQLETVIKLARVDTRFVVD
jgi:predicted nucleic acid-binding protein